MAEIIAFNGERILVDQLDFESLNKFKWHLDTHGYPRRSQNTVEGKVTTIIISRQIMDAVKGQIVDHINGDPLDNRRQNLRFISLSENAMNRRKRSPVPRDKFRKFSSQFKGVKKVTNSQKWRAYITPPGSGRKEIALGSFGCEHEAAHAYNKAAIEFFGEYAVLNPVGQDKGATDGAVEGK